jgi:hypothetical protein
MEVAEAEATGGVVGDQEFSPELLRFFYGGWVGWWVVVGVFFLLYVAGCLPAMSCQSNASDFRLTD